MRLILIACLILALTGAVMAETVIQTKWFCPKCGSENVEITREKPEVRYQRKSLDEWVGETGLMMNDLVMRYYTWTARCKDCGYTVEKSLPY